MKDPIKVMDIAAVRLERQMTMERALRRIEGAAGPRGGPMKFEIIDGPLGDESAKRSLVPALEASLRGEHEHPQWRWADQVPGVPEMLHTCGRCGGRQGLTIWNGAFCPSCEGEFQLGACNTCKAPRWRCSC